MGQRLWHPKWWSRYVWGYFATMQIACFVSEQQYGIDRSKCPDQLWPWWNEIQQKKRKGEIPADMPGYMLAAYQNESEQRWAAAREAAAEAAHEELVQSSLLRFGQSVPIASGVERVS